jgi:hypothetical protein
MLSLRVSIRYVCWVSWPISTKFHINDMPLETIFTPYFKYPSITKTADAQTYEMGILLVSYKWY